MAELANLGPGHGRAYWVYWGLTSMIAAAVGGLVLPRLLEGDPFNLRRVIE